MKLILSATNVTLRFIGKVKKFKILNLVNLCVFVTFWQCITIKNYYFFLIIFGSASGISVCFATNPPQVR